MPTRVFLSYGRGDDHPDYDDPEKSFMCRLYNSLTTAGFEVWWDRKNLGNDGRTFLDLIREGVGIGDKLVLVVGQHAIGSPYVKAEWEYALSICAPVIPILRNGDFSLIPQAIGMGNAPDFRDLNKYDERLADLVRILNEDNAPLGLLHGVGDLPRGYINRTEDMDAVEAMLRSDSLAPTVITTAQRATSLYGMGGIGKSTLAKAIAQGCDIRRKFPDGLIWLEVGQTPDITRLQASIGAIFGDDQNNEYKDPDTGKRRLSGILYDKQVLLILDDVWEGDHVDYFRVGSADCRVFITTRSHRLADQIGAYHYELNKLSSEQGLALIATYLGTDISAQTEILTQIVEILDGHTLAVSLVAGQLQENGLDYAPNLKSALETFPADDPFENLNLDPANKNLNLEKSLRISYQNLGGIPQSSDDAEDTQRRQREREDLQRRFRALGVLAQRASFSEDLAMALWEDTDIAKTHRALNHLCQVSLLTREGSGRYSQHNLLWVYARALVVHANDIVKVENIYFEWIIKFANHFKTISLEKWHDQVDPDTPHILYVGDLIHKKYINNTSNNTLQDIGERFAHNTIEFLSYRPEIHRVEWLEMGLAISQQRKSPEYSADFLQALGVAWNDLGEHQQALDYYQQALTNFRTGGNSAGEAMILNNLGKLWSGVGEKQKALNYYEQALLIFRNIGNHSWEATTLINIGAIWFVWGENQKALDYFQKALPIFRADGNRYREAATLSNIGQILSVFGEHKEAFDYYEQALLIFRSIGNRFAEAKLLNNFGGLYSRLGEKQKALNYYEQALPLFRAVRSRSEEAGTLRNIGNVWSALGEKQKALDYYEQALPLFRVVGDRLGEASTLRNIGTVWIDLESYQQALDYYEQALPIFQNSGDRGAEASILGNTGVVWSALGEKKKALDYYEQALPLFRAVGDRSGEASSLLNIGAIWFNLESYQQALDYYEQALTLYRAVDSRSQEASVLINIGKVWNSLEKPSQALNYYEEALALCRVVGDRYKEALTCYDMAIIYANSENLDKAIEYIEIFIMLDEQIQHPNLANDRATLEKLKQRKVSMETSPKQSSFIRKLWQRLNKISGN